MRTDKTERGASRPPRSRAALPFPHSSREPNVSPTTLSELVVPAGVPAL